MRAWYGAIIESAMNATKKIAVYSITNYVNFYKDKQCKKVRSSGFPVFLQLKPMTIL